MGKDIFGSAIFQYFQIPVPFFRFFPDSFSQFRYNHSFCVKVAAVSDKKTHSCRILGFMIFQVPRQVKVRPFGFGKGGKFASCATEDCHLMNNDIRISCIPKGRDAKLFLNVEKSLLPLHGMGKFTHTAHILKGGVVLQFIQITVYIPADTSYIFHNFLQGGRSGIKFHFSHAAAVIGIA